MQKDKIQYAEDDVGSVNLLLRLRIPSLLIGLLLGIALSFIVSQFEIVLEENITLVFFIPFIVYLADAVGTQTQSIYIRDLKTGRANFKIYFLKESLLGIVIGLIFGLITALIVMIWFNDLLLTLAVSLGVSAAVFSAPLIAIIVTEILQLEKEDPAIWAGPIATVIQDAVSVLIYGLIASAIIL